MSSTLSSMPPSLLELSRRLLRPFVLLGGGTFAASSSLVRLSACCTIRWHVAHLMYERSAFIGACFGFLYLSMSFLSSGRAVQWLQLVAAQEVLFKPIT